MNRKIVSHYDLDGIEYSHCSGDVINILNYKLQNLVRFHSFSDYVTLHSIAIYLRFIPVVGVYQIIPPFKKK